MREDATVSRRTSARAGVVGAAIGSADRPGIGASATARGPRPSEPSTCRGTTTAGDSCEEASEGSRTSWRSSEDAGRASGRSVANAGTERPVAFAVRLVSLVGGVAVGAGRVAAHAGTTHAGTPHWLLFALVLVGLGTVAAGVVGLRRRGFVDRYAVVGTVVGTLLFVLGSIGLVEIQVTPAVAPGWTEQFEYAAALLGVLVAVGSLGAGYRYWPRRPRYAWLGTLLGGWVAYPAVMPDGGLLHPLGYILAAAVPVTVGYVVWRDAGQEVAEVFRRRTPRRAASASVALFAVFFSFSAGALTVNPDLTRSVPSDGFVTAYRVASPLVYWPAVEFYVPAVPLAGFVSLGTLLLIAVLGGLVGLNVAVVADGIATDDGAELTRTSLGALTTTGATACCCCAPASYAALSVVFGTAASPVYWAFMDPTSPVGGTFFAASVLLLTGSLVGTTSERRGTCPSPNDVRSTTTDA